MTNGTFGGTGPDTSKPDKAHQSDLRGALREAIQALELALGKLSFAPRNDHTAARIGAALIRARSALNHPAPPETDHD